MMTRTMLCLAGLALIAAGPAFAADKPECAEYCVLKILTKKLRVTENGQRKKLTAAETAVLASQLPLQLVPVPGDNRVMTMLTKDGRTLVVRRTYIEANNLPQQDLSPVAKSGGGVGKNYGVGRGYGSK
jgi:hypothetical protein